MSIKDIITVPNEILKKTSAQIETVDNNIKKLAKDMLETMYQHKGIGLAAVQIGILKNLIVIDVSEKDKEKNPLVFINPKIKRFSDEISSYEEGCLSIPDTFIEIERPKFCVVEYIGLDGKKKEMECDGLLSTCLQHECDHLEGKLIIDFLSKLKKEVLIKKLSKHKNSNRIVV
ncbi:MAG: peptide deformylase [Candidatus Pelagibacter sp.]|nr:peptide deformylase [Candidatus Pelagibacter sp.]|tara:strand:- start:3815 stop:4336 length:522 start_codon:yes stop_codon:yes gene_type:complete